MWLFCCSSPCGVVYHSPHPYGMKTPSYILLILTRPVSACGMRQYHIKQNRDDSNYDNTNNHLLFRIYALKINQSNTVPVPDVTLFTISFSKVISFTPLFLLISSQNVFQIRFIYAQFTLYWAKIRKSFQTKTFSLKFTHYLIEVSLSPYSYHQRVV